MPLLALAFYCGSIRPKCPLSLIRPPRLSALLWITAFLTRLFRDRRSRSRSKCFALDFTIDHFRLSVLILSTMNIFIQSTLIDRRNSLLIFRFLHAWLTLSHRKCLRPSSTLLTQNLYISLRGCLLSLI